VAVVFLIACINIANLFLSKSVARQREIGTRAALGASRLRLIRQLLFEGFPLVLGAGLVGVGLAWWELKLAPFARVDIPRLANARLDVPTVAFACTLCCFAVVLFSLIPAFRVSKPELLGQMLKEGGRGMGAGGAHQRLLRLLVASQFGMSLVLLVAAGLLLRSFSRLATADVGFRSEGALSLSLRLPSSTYSSDNSFRSFTGRLFNQLHGIGSVTAVGVATDLPLGVRSENAFSIEDGNSIPSQAAAVIWVFGNYFESIGARLEQGRFLTSNDAPGSERVVVVSKGFVRRYFPGQDVLGRRIRWGIGPRNRNPWMTIVGVVGDIKDGPIRDSVRPEIFQPCLQVPSLDFDRAAGSVFRSLSVVVRSSVPPAELAQTVREQIRKIDPELPITDIQPLQEYVRKSIDSERISASIFGVFAIIAVLIAAIGAYGTVSYWVVQRTSEIGVRAALGASRKNILQLITREGMKLALMGIAGGIAVSVVGMRFVSSLLYQVSPTDPSTFASVIFLLFGVAVLAAYIPARRATRIDPMLALRSE
jgi:predicted permease